MIWKELRHNKWSVVIKGIHPANKNFHKTWVVIARGDIKVLYRRMTEGRKASRASDQNGPPPLPLNPLAEGLDPPLNS